ncbi:MAG TPA: hypothetical protein VFH80_28320 [Solirubrobacteraceae bacterium]|nr:hypothetical protein [Solirubrobacteraceae bacterium]
MRVTLAYPYGKHQPDETVEVEDAVGLQLINDGRARHPATSAPTTPATPAPKRATTRRARGRSKE